MSHKQIALCPPPLPVDPVLRADVAKGRFKVTLNGGDEVVLELDRATLELPTGDPARCATSHDLDVADGDHILDGIYEYIDASGLDSEDRTFHFEFTIDTIPPVQPGEVSMMVIDAEHDPEPEPDPEPDPDPTPEPEPTPDPDPTPEPEPTPEPTPDPEPPTG